MLDGKGAQSISSNYLGFADHPELKRAAKVIDNYVDGNIGQLQALRVLTLNSRGNWPNSSMRRHCSGGFVANLLLFPLSQAAATCLQTGSTTPASSTAAAFQGQGSEVCLTAWRTEKKILEHKDSLAGCS